MVITVNGIPLREALKKTSNFLKEDEARLTNSSIYLSSKISKKYLIFYRNTDGSKYLFLSDDETLKEAGSSLKRMKRSGVVLLTLPETYEKTVNTAYRKLHKFLNNKEKGIYNLEKLDVSDIFKDGEDIHCYKLTPKKEKLYYLPKKINSF